MIESAPASLNVRRSRLSRLTETFGMALANANLYVVNFPAKTIGEYDATTRAAIDAISSPGLTA